MANLIIRLPDDKHERLKELARRRNISVNKLIEELSTIAIAKFDTETRFERLSAQGSVESGLSLLDRLDSELSKRL